MITEEQLQGALAALPLDELLYRMCNAVLQIDKGLPASVMFVMMSTVYSVYLSQSERATLARFLRMGADEMCDQQTEYVH